MAAANVQMLSELLAVLAPLTLTYLIAILSQRNVAIRENMGEEVQLLLECEREVERTVTISAENIQWRMRRKYGREINAWLLRYMGLVAHEWSIAITEIPQLPKSIRTLNCDDEQNCWGRTFAKCLDRISQLRASISSRSEQRPYWSVLLFIISIALLLSLYSLAIEHYFVVTLLIAMFITHLYDVANIAGRYGMHDVEAQKVLRIHFLARLARQHEPGELIGDLCDWRAEIRKQRCMYICGNTARSQMVLKWYRFFKMDWNDQTIIDKLIRDRDEDYQRVLNYPDAIEDIRSMKIYEIHKRYVIPLAAALGVAILQTLIYVPIAMWDFPASNFNPCNTMEFVVSFLVHGGNILLGAHVIACVMRQDDKFLDVCRQHWLKRGRASHLCDR